jgi:hypothetical protein
MKLGINVYEGEKMYMTVFLLIIILMIGLYCLTLGLWELREGMDRKKYITYMFTGLVLIFIVPKLFGISLGIFSLFNNY